MKKITILSLLLVLSFNIFAQSNYWDKAEAKYNRDYRESIRTNMNMKPGVSPSVNYPNNNTSLNDLFPTKAEKAAREKASEQRIAEEAYKYRAEELERNRIKNLKDSRASEFKYNYCKNMFDYASGNKSIIDDCDLMEYTEWMYADNYGGTKYSATVNNCLARLKDYYRESAEASYDSCTARLRDAVIFPNTTIRELNKLKVRFPNKIEELEKQEFLTMTYFFGAFIPNYIKTDGDFVYPLCQYEYSCGYTSEQLFSSERKIKLLNRFLYLFYKYPTYASENVIFKTRKNFNPLLLVTTVNEYLGGISTELMFNMHKSVIFAKAPQLTAIYKNAKMEKIARRDLFNERCKSSAIYLRKRFPAYVATLTPQEWINIATAHKVTLDDVFELFAFNETEKERMKVFQNFINAKKNNLENVIKDGFCKIDTGHYTYYEGNFKNGKPNGEGKFKGGGSYGRDYFFEGTFKDGLPQTGFYLYGSDTEKHFESFDLETKDAKKLYIKE